MTNSQSYADKEYLYQGHIIKLWFCDSNDYCDAGWYWGYLKEILSTVGKGHCNLFVTTRPACLRYEMMQ